MCLSLPLVRPNKDNLEAYMKINEYSLPANAEFYYNDDGENLTEVDRQFKVLEAKWKTQASLTWVDTLDTFKDEVVENTDTTMNIKPIEDVLLTLGYKKRNLKGAHLYANAQKYFVSLTYVDNGYWDLEYDIEGKEYRASISPYTENLETYLKEFLRENRVR